MFKAATRVNLICIPSCAVKALHVLHVTHVWVCERPSTARMHN
jgi:hypothetical protein